MAAETIVAETIVEVIMEAVVIMAATAVVVVITLERRYATPPTDRVSSAGVRRRIESFVGRIVSAGAGSFRVNGASREREADGADPERPSHPAHTGCARRGSHDNLPAGAGPA